MSLPEKIMSHVQALPEPVQAEVLDFVEYLEAKVRKGTTAGYEESDWPELSLAFAMRGMEDEPELYSLDDIKENFA